MGRDKILVRGICQNFGWWGDPPSPPPTRGNPVVSQNAYEAVSERE